MSAEDDQPLEEQSHLEEHPKYTFLSIHTPIPWFANDPSHPRRVRQYRMVITQIIMFLFLNILQAVYMSTWSLYTENPVYFGVLTIFAITQFVCVSHNCNSLIAMVFYLLTTCYAAYLWIVSWILFGLVIEETVICGDIPAEDYRVYLDCYQMEPQALSSASIDCTLGSDLKTRATGTCPELLFKSQSLGNAWLFFQYVVVLYWIVTLFINIADNLGIIGVLVRINQVEAREAYARRQRSIRENFLLSGETVKNGLRF